MKIYDVISHRSFNIDPESVNIYATRKKVGVVTLNECGDQYMLPHATGHIFTNMSTSQKILNKPRKSWKKQT